MVCKHLALIWGVTWTKSYTDVNDNGIGNSIFDQNVNRIACGCPSSSSSFDVFGYLAEKRCRYRLPHPLRRTGNPWEQYSRWSNAFLQRHVEPCHFLDGRSVS